jgi:predicted N-acetyltransferase YhbS
MGLELVPARMEHVPEIGRICYEAFKDISDKHHFRSDFHSTAFARQIMAMLIQREDEYGVVAMYDGQPAGSNYLLGADEVGGLGPISVECSLQGHGIGRALMQDVLDHGRESGREMIRLLQDSFNMTSLALYASLGFDTKHPVALLEIAAAPASDDSIRPATSDDVPGMDELCRAIYKVSRRNEIASNIGGPFQPFVRERNGHIVGYYTLGLLGHGVAEGEDDMFALITEVARQAPAEERHCLFPIREGGLYRRLLEAGSRNIKVMNLMALGPYEEPDGVWAPSVLY